MIKVKVIVPNNNKPLIQLEAENEEDRAILDSAGFCLGSLFTVVHKYPRSETWLERFVPARKVE